MELKLPIITTRRAERIAEQHAAEAVAEVTANTDDVIRDAVTRAFAETNRGDLPDPPRGVRGSDGDPLWASLAETNRELAGPLRWPLYNEMRRSDPACRSAISMYTLGITSGRWFVEPASSDGVDELIAECCRDQFGLEGRDGWLNVPWKQSVRQALLMLPFGAMYEEIMWGLLELRSWAPRDGGAEPREIVPILQLAPRFPATIPIDGVPRDRRTGRILEVRQSLPDTLPIPGEKIVDYVLEREGADPYGTSLLRAMYGPWKLKKAVMLASAIGWDRWAGGLPEVRWPLHGGAQYEQEARAAARDVRSGERQYVAFEGTPEDGWGFKLHTATLQEPSTFLGWFNSEIARAAHLQFMELAHSTDSGSWALGRTQESPYYQALLSVAEEIVTQRQRVVFRRFVDYNWGPQYNVPRLRVTGLEPEDLERLATVIGTLADAGLTFTDLETQNDLRARLPLPLLEKLPAGGSVIPAFGTEEGEGLAQFADAEALEQAFAERMAARFGLTEAA